MDVCAECSSQRIIIENKVDSGLNGLNSSKSSSQLSTYYDKWGIKKKEEPLCFVTVPDYRLLEIQKEIKIQDPSMESKYILVSYGEIAKFLDNENKLGYLSSNFVYKELINQIIGAFQNLSQTTLEEYYANMFFLATNKC